MSTVAVVTGASSGIGAAVARELARAGHAVVLGARRVERLDALADEVRAAGGEAHPVALDLCDAASVAAFCDAALAAPGELAVVVSNAGDVQALDVHGDPDRFRAQLEVNLLGPQRLLHHLLPAMVERRRGDVVLVTSEVAVRPRPHVAGYVAAKAGLEALGRALAMELEGTGVRAAIVRPGPTGTEQGSTWTGDDVMHVVPSWDRWGFMRHPAMLSAEDVAQAVAHVVAAPLGGGIAIVEVQPTAPVTEEEP